MRPEYLNKQLKNSLPSSYFLIILEFKIATNKKSAVLQSQWNIQCGRLQVLKSVLSPKRVYMCVHTFFNLNRVHIVGYIMGHSVYFNTAVTKQDILKILRVSSQKRLKTISYYHGNMK